MNRNELLSLSFPSRTFPALTISHRSQLHDDGVMDMVTGQRSSVTHCMLKVKILYNHSARVSREAPAYSSSVERLNMVEQSSTLAQHGAVACGARLVAKDPNVGALPVWKDSRRSEL